MTQHRILLIHIAIPVIALFLANCGKLDLTKEELSVECKRDYEKVYRMNLRGTSTKLYIKTNATQRIDIWRAAAAAGIPEGQFLYGECRRRGTETRKDEKEAVKLYHEAADQGLSLAMIRLHYCYRRGIGVSKSLETAKSWVQRGHELGDSLSTKFLGDHDAYWDEEAGDPKLGIRRYNEAYEQGCAAGAYELGMLHETGKFVDRNYEKAIEWYEPAAAKGNRFASWRLAVIYEQGLGVPKNLKKSEDYVFLAAAQGHPAMAYLLAVWYGNGHNDIPKNSKESLRWCRTAAEILDHPEAMRSLGARYDEGQGVKKSHSLAFHWYTKAANLGEVQAIFNLAHYYLEGKGTREDPEKAIKLLERAIEKNFAPAMNSLGVLYSTGKHVPVDLKRSRELWEKGAKLDDRNSQHNLWLLKNVPDVSKLPVQMKDL